MIVRFAMLIFAENGQFKAHKYSVYDGKIKMTEGMFRPKPNVWPIKYLVFFFQYDSKIVLPCECECKGCKILCPECSESFSTKED